MAYKDPKYIGRDTESDSDLEHFGVLGMKWGVHKNGIGVQTQRKIGDNFSNHVKKKMTSQAKSTLRKQIKESKAKADMSQRTSKKLYKKADKLVWKSESYQNKGNNEKFQKYQGLAWNRLLNSHIAEQNAKKFLEQSKYFEKKLSQIKDGTLQAGRDFVTNVTSTINPLYRSVTTDLEFKDNRKNRTTVSSTGYYR